MLIFAQSLEGWYDFYCVERGNRLPFGFKKDISGKAEGRTFPSVFVDSDVVRCFLFFVFSSFFLLSFFFLCFLYIFPFVCCLFRLKNRIGQSLVLRFVVFLLGGRALGLCRDRSSCWSGQ